LIINYHSKHTKLNHILKSVEEKLQLLLILITTFNYLIYISLYYM